MEDLQIIERDKHDTHALRFRKVEVLALGMLTCMLKAGKVMRGRGLAVMLKRGSLLPP